MKLPIKPINEPLYVVAVISNSQRFLRRYELYRLFEKYVQDSGAILYTVELALGEREFEVTTSDNPRHIQLRSEHELWHKENMINIGVSRLPSDWKYVAWIDADVTFARPDWVDETIHMLQHYDVVQMFSYAQDVGNKWQPIGLPQEGIMHKWARAGCPEKYEELNCYGVGSPGYAKASEGHPGYNSAYTRYAWDTLGGMYDMAMLGSGDRHMALSLLGMPEYSMYNGISEGYKRSIQMWADRAAKLKRNVGYVDGLLTHHHHGNKSLRQYTNRWRIAVDNQYDPYTDIYKDWQGLWQLSGNKPRFRDGVRRYMSQRNEDCVRDE